MLLDQENNTVGYSKKAARRGVTMVVLSRILMAVPSCGKTSTQAMCDVFAEYTLVIVLALVVFILY